MAASSSLDVKSPNFYRNQLLAPVSPAKKVVVKTQLEELEEQVVATADRISHIEARIAIATAKIDLIGQKTDVNIERLERHIDEERQSINKTTKKITRLESCTDKLCCLAVLVVILAIAFLCVLITKKFI